MGAVEIINALNQPTQRLINAVSGAIGKVYEPHYKKRMADAEAYEIEKIGNTIRANCDMPIVYNPDGTLQIDTSDYECLIKRTGLRLAFQEVKKQENIESVVDSAYQLLEQEETVSNEPVDNGWMIRFMNSVGDISNKELQELWGKILAGEIKQPHSISLRTLNIISNLSRQDAELFMKYCPFVLLDDEKSACIIREDKETMQKYDMKYNDILKLDECGLLSSNAFIYSTTTDITETTTIFHGEGFKITATPTNDHPDISVGIFPLSESGKELYQVVKNTANRNYINEVTEKLKKQYANYDIDLQFTE